jgi:hypothetical protein
VLPSIAPMRSQAETSVVKTGSKPASASRRYLSPYDPLAKKALSTILKMVGVNESMKGARSSNSDSFVHDWRGIGNEVR